MAFPSAALGRAVPSGVCDRQRTQGYVRVGTSADTPRLALEVVRRWWEGDGLAAYLRQTHLLILADGGGSNSYRSRVGKQQLPEQVCDCWGLTVTSELHEAVYQTGETVSDAEFAQLNLEHLTVCPQRTYPLRPRTPQSLDHAIALPCQELVS